MGEALNNPAVQSALLPLLVAVLAAPAFAAVQSRWAALAIPLGFLAGYVAAVGVPPLPPVSSTQKIPYLVVAAPLLVLLLDRGVWWRRASVVLWTVLALGWLSWPRLDADPLSVAAGMVACLALFWLLEKRPNQDTAVCFLVAGLVFAGVAFLGSSASIAQGAGSLSAAAGGLLLWCWPRDRWPSLAAGALLGVVACFALLAQQALLYTRASSAALALLAMIPLVPLLPLSFPAKDRPRRAFALLVTSLPLAAGALAFAWYKAQGGSY